MDKEKVKARVLEMKAQGKSAGEIAEIFNAKGITTPSGLKFTAQKIFTIVYQDKKKSAYVKKAKHLLGNTDDDATEANDDIVNLLNSTRYTDRQKVEAVKALLR